MFGPGAAGAAGPLHQLGDRAGGQLLPLRKPPGAFQPHGMMDTLDFMVDDIEEATGIRVEVPLNKKGAEILFVTAVGRLRRRLRASTPAWATCSCSTSWDWTTPSAPMPPRAGTSGCSPRTK